MRGEEKPVESEAKGKENEAKAKETKEFLTQGFVHGGQSAPDGMGSQRKIAKIFESGGKARIYGRFCACPGVETHRKPFVERLENGG